MIMEKADKTLDDDVVKTYYKNKIRISDEELKVLVISITR